MSLIFQEAQSDEFWLLTLCVAQSLRKAVSMPPSLSLRSLPRTFSTLDYFSTETRIELCELLGSHLGQHELLRRRIFRSE